ncbi:inner membrane protein import complex subunit Tim54-domain-containing protein [Camillea tinctor]|nr:inner membrane protein import complex subunit Tim54-domain-containing protein [Camillea tinctor]
MADPNPPPATGGNGPPTTPASASASASTSTASPTNAPPPAANYKAAAPNPALRMMGLPGLPKKLPSRNWLIFWALAGSFSGAIIYDRREKKRATARWSRAVSHLAREPLPSPTQLPRKLTVFLSGPPGDGLRVAQDHFTEYVKPVLAASGLDWEFVQGRREGDVRAAVAERVRRARNPPAPDAAAQTHDEIVRDIRARNGTPEYRGMRGDVVVGRHAWKEYVRGLHEGWLGPLAPPPEPVVLAQPVEGEAEEKKKKDERPPQPPPYNTPSSYPTSALPLLIPAEFSPAAPIPFPHILGFSNTFIRLGRFLTRRRLADDIGREVAAACLAASREWRDDDEAREALAVEERDWPKSVWKEDEPEKTEDGESGEKKKQEAERIWTRPVVLDPRVSMRMRRFEMRPEDEARAREIVVPEEEVEGWIKGSLRSLWRWAVSDPEPKSTWVDE